MSAPQLTPYQQGLGSVNADGLNTFEQTCNVFNDMRAVVGVTGMQVWARGGVTINDGLQGPFYWNGTLVNPVDDNANTIVPTGSAQGAWVRNPVTAQIAGFTSTGTALLPNNDASESIGSANKRLATVNSVQYLLYGSASGVITLQGQSAAGTFTLTLPNTAPPGGTSYLQGNGPSSPLSWGSSTAVNPALQRGQIGGLTLSNDGGSPNTVLDISAGFCTSSDLVSVMQLSAFTKSISGTWVVGSGTNGLDTGTIAASTWYHVFVIQRSDTLVVDVLFSLSATSPTLPTSYTQFRRIGSFRTNASSQIIAFTQNGNEFLWSVFPQDYGTTIANGAQSLTLTVPTGVVVNALIFGQYSNSNAAPIYILITSLATTSTATSSSLSMISTQVTGQNIGFGVMSIRTNTSAQIRFNANAASGTLSLCTMGWLDSRGQFA